MSDTISYAPYIPPVTGNRKLACVALKWQDNPGANPSGVANSCKATAANFKRLSSGQFNFTPSSYQIATPYTHSGENVRPAVAYAKKVLAGKGIMPDGNTTYAMVNNGALGGSYSGGDTSNILNTLTTTFYHEIGRDNPINLGSSGAYRDGKYVWQSDGTSFMSHFSSSELTASQLYYLGWLPNTKVAYHNDPTKTISYTIDALSPGNPGKNLQAVLIPSVANKPLFLSRPTLKRGAGVTNALHFASGGNNRGSMRLGFFGDQMNYEGLSFKQISQSGDTATIQISPQSPTTSERNTATTLDPKSAPKHRPKR